MLKIFNQEFQEKVRKIMFLSGRSGIKFIFSARDNYSKAIKDVQLKDKDASKGFYGNLHVF